MQAGGVRVVLEIESDSEEEGEGVGRSGREWERGGRGG